MGKKLKKFDATSDPLHFKRKIVNYLLIQKKEWKMPFDTIYIKTKCSCIYKQVFVFQFFPPDRSNDLTHLRLFQLPFFRFPRESDREKERKKINERYSERKEKGKWGNKKKVNTEVTDISQFTSWLQSEK